MSKKHRPLSFGRDLDEPKENQKKSLSECKDVNEYLAQFEDAKKMVGANKLPPVDQNHDFEPELGEPVRAPYASNPFADAAKEAVRSYLRNVGEDEKEEEPLPTPKTKPQPIIKKEEEAAPKVEAAQPQQDLQRRHRSSIYLKKMYDHECIAVQDRLGDVMLFPLQHVITAKIIPGEEEKFIHGVASVIALSATPSAIFTRDDFADYVEAANVSAINPKSTFIGTMDEFLYAFRIWSYLENELMVVKKELDERYGEHIFASSIMLMLTGIYPRSPLSVPKYRRLVSTTIYDTKWEETARDNFIKFLIGEFERGRAEEPLNAYDLEDYINYDLFEEVSSCLEVDEEFEEDAPEEDPEDAAVAAMFQQALEEMGGNDEENMEVVIDDRNGSNGAAPEDVGEPVQEVVDKRSRGARVNSVSGQGFGEMVQNVYAQANLQQSVRLSTTAKQSGGDGHWPTLEEIEKDAAQKVKEQEEAQKARSVNDRPGAGGGEASQKVQKEEKEEDTLVIPVNRGGRG